MAELHSHQRGGGGEHTRHFGEERWKKIFTLIGINTSEALLFS